MTRIERETQALKRENLALHALGLASEGRTNHEIATALHVHERTAKRLVKEGREVLAEAEKPKKTLSDYMTSVIADPIQPIWREDPATGRATLDDLQPYRDRAKRERAFDPEGYEYRLEKAGVEAQLAVLRKRNTTSRARGLAKADQDARASAALDREIRAEEGRRKKTPRHRGSSSST